MRFPFSIFCSAAVTCASAVAPAVESIAYQADHPFDGVVRIDVSVPITGAEFLDGVDFDTSVTLSCDWQQHDHLYDEGAIGALWGLGAAVVYQSIDSTIPDPDFPGFTLPIEGGHYGLSGRYYLGLTYDVFAASRISLVGYGGLGLGVIEGTIGDGAGGTLVDDSKANVLAEFGVQLHWVFTFDAFNLGLGASYMSRTTSATLEGDGLNLDVDLDQTMISGHLNLGYAF